MEDTTKVRGGETGATRHLTELELSVAEMLVDVRPGGTDLGAFKSRGQFPVLPGAFAKLVGEKGLQAHDAVDRLAGQVGDREIGPAQTAWRHPQPGQALNQSPRARLAGRRGQDLAAGDGGHMSALQDDRDGHVNEPRVTDIAQRPFQDCGPFVKSTIASIAPGQAFRMSPNEQTHRIAHPEGGGKVGLAHSGTIQGHRQSHEFLENGCELGKFTRIGQQIEVAGGS